MHTYTFSTELVSRLVRTLACGGLAVFFAPDSTDPDHCSTNRLIAPVAPIKSAEERIKEQLQCNSSHVTIAEACTLSAHTSVHTARSRSYPCYVSGSVGTRAYSYCWESYTCTLTVLA